MTKINLLINILFPLLVITFSVISQCSCILSDKRLCYNPECSEPVSLGKTTLTYSPNEGGLLRFNVNVDVTVYSKEAGSRNDLWGVEIHGKRGYAPKSFIKEYKILHKDLKYEVPVNDLPSNNGKDDSSDRKLLPKKQNDVYKVVKNTEPFNGQIDISNLKSTQEEVPHTLTGITPPFEVIDGTTIKLSEDEPSVQPDIVANVLQATTVLNEQTVIKSGLDVRSNLKQSESNILAKSDGLQQEIIDTSKEHKDHDVSHQISFKDILASSEEILDLPQVIETEVSSFGMNVNSKGNLTEKSDVDKESIDNNEKSNIEGEPLEKIVDISSIKFMSDGLKAVNTADTKDVKPLMHDAAKETSVIDTEGTESLVSAHTKEIIGIDIKGSEKSISAPVTESPLPDIRDTESSTTNSVNADAPTDSKPAGPVPEHVDIIVTGTKDPKPLLSNSVKESTLTHTEDTESSIADPVKTNITNVFEHTDPVLARAKKSSITDIKNVKPSVPDHIEAATATDAKDVKSSESEYIKGTTASDTKDITSDTNVGSLSSAESKPQAADAKVIAAVVDNSKKIDDKHIEGATESELKDAHNLDKSGSHLEVGQTNTVGYISSLLQELGIASADKGTIPDTNVVVEEQNVPEMLTRESDGKTVSTTDLENTTFSDARTSNILGLEEVNVAPDIHRAPFSLESEVDNLNLTENNNIDNVLEKEITNKNMEGNMQDYTATELISSGNEVASTNVDLENNTFLENEKTSETNVNIVNSKENLVNDFNSAEVPIKWSEFSQHIKEKSDLNAPEHVLHSSHESMIPDHISNTEKYLIASQEGFKVQQSKQSEIDDIVSDKEGHATDEILPEYGGDINVDKVLRDTSNDEDIHEEVPTSNTILHEVQVSQPDVCSTDDECANNESAQQNHYMDDGENSQNDENFIISGIKVDHNYWLTLIYLSVTAAATLIFSLGYYYIENLRRDWQLIAKINKLEKDLLVSTKECTMLNENLKATKDKLTCIEDESFGSNEMVLSLKADLEASQVTKVELEDQVVMLEKDLETATEAGLELERMLREVLSSNNEVNPLAQSVEDLQARLNAQQAANESLTNALNLMTQEKEALSADLTSLTKKYEELKVEFTRVTDSLKMEIDSKNTMEQTLSDKVHRSEMKIKEISTEKAALQKELKGKEAETKDLVNVINQLNSNNLDLDKLYDVSRIKADATALLEERDELKIRLAEVEGAHNLLEEHMKVVKEEIATLTEQCKLAEKDKKDAETRLEVLSNFFKEKEAQRQKEEAIWLQKQGEVVSTVERIQTMQNEIQNYKQQVEILKHEILDQEREYKGQISLLEMKAHEQWVVARQVERRLEESKAEAGQLRNRLTLIEKNINDVDPEQKLHRLEANGETTTSLPLFIGAESSSSPIMFTGSSGVPPPPPPSYLHSLFPPYLPPPPLPSTSGVPPYEVGQRPPPLGGRLSSPPPMPLHPPAPSRYDNAGSPPPPMSPHMFPSFNHHRSPPPPFGSDRIHPPPPPHGPILHPPLGTTHSWGEEPLPLPRNSGFHPHQRERIRNHKDSLHSSGESLDKTHHSSKV